MEINKYTNEKHIEVFRILLQRYPQYNSLNNKDLFKKINENSKLKRELFDAYNFQKTYYYAIKRIGKLSLSEILALKKLQDKRIKRITEKGRKRSKYTWDKSVWKHDIRPEVIGKKCESCGSTENRRIHHTKKYYKNLTTYKKAVASLFAKELRVNEAFFNLCNSKVVLPETIFFRYNVYHCPFCDSSSVYERTRDSPKRNYRCNECKKEFDERKEIFRILAYNHDQQRDFVLKEFKPYIHKTALKIYLECKEEYEKCKYVITLCNSCHFQYDKLRRIKCRVCQNNYHSIFLPACLDCAPKGEYSKKEKICFLCGKSRGEHKRNLLCFYEKEIKISTIFEKSGIKTLEDYF